MFRCVSAPAEPQFQPTLAGNGFKYDEKTTEFRNIKQPDQYLHYFHTDNEHVNDIRKEAIHEGMRRKIAEKVTTEHIRVHDVRFDDMDILYITANGSIHYDRPNGIPHVTIMCTKVSELRFARDCIVVIGESEQDAGIWAWRTASGKGGIDKGSIVGLRKRINAGGRGLSVAEFEEAVEECMVEQWTGPVKPVRNMTAPKDNTPAIVVLNPGQLLYSYKLNKNMTFASWNSRQREDAFSQDFQIDEEYNFVKGHETQARHIHTCFEHILPQIFDPRYCHFIRFHPIMIGNGAAHGLEALDQILLNKNEMEVRGGEIASCALIEPIGIDFETLHSEKFAEFLKEKARSWAQSDSTRKGELVAAPGMWTAPTEEEMQDMLEAGGAPPEPLRVLCETYSAGPHSGVVETVFPEMQDQVLEYVFRMIREARKTDPDMNPILRF